VEESKQQLAGYVMELITGSSSIAEVWEKLAELAARYGQSTTVLDSWFDRLLQNITSEYNISQERYADLQTIRQLALDPGEPVSEVAMEILLSQRLQAADEIAATLNREHDNAPSGGELLIVKRLYPDARLPQHATKGATGLDLFAYIKEHGGWVVLHDKPKLIGTGIAIEVPKGYDAQIRPRSGLSARGVMVSFGTVDSDYRGEVMVTMYTLGRDSSFEVKHGDRIAQLIIGRLADLAIKEAEELSATERGPQGHGSTGIA
jgi:dUTP pyrophosphatase